MLTTRYAGWVSQPEVLRHFMEDAVLLVPGTRGTERVRLTHGFEGRATLVTPVVDHPHQLEDPGTFRFCPMSGLIITKVYSPGDGGDLSVPAAIQNIVVPQAGYLVIRNAIVRSNGANTVRADQLTEVVMLGGESWRTNELLDRELVVARAYAESTSRPKHRARAQRVLELCR
ncbi:hypothetical protein HGA91_02420 [candidate division WWE3 bacterium]|nr:hypothetical protein [candidate division WWE3 bacterium]